MTIQTQLQIACIFTFANVLRLLNLKCKSKVYFQLYCPCNLPKLRITIQFEFPMPCKKTFQSLSGVGLYNGQCLYWEVMSLTDDCAECFEKWRSSVKAPLKAAANPIDACKGPDSANWVFLYSWHIRHRKFHCFNPKCSDYPLLTAGVHNSHQANARANRQCKSRHIIFLSFNP